MREDYSIRSRGFSIWYLMAYFRSIRRQRGTLPHRRLQDVAQWRSRLADLFRDCPPDEGGQSLNDLNNNKVACKRMDLRILGSRGVNVRKAALKLLSASELA